MNPCCVDLKPSLSFHLTLFEHKVEVSMVITDIVLSSKMIENPALAQIASVYHPL